MYTIGIILIFGIVFIITIIGIFNRFAKFRNRVKDAWSKIDVALKRCHDLIPNFLKTIPMAKVFPELCLPECSSISISISLKRRLPTGKI